ncbi:MAG: phospholipase [Aquabacterium sp.]|nr:MAG: phospholipase [Aquabacterium sp.]
MTEHEDTRVSIDRRALRIHAGPAARRHIEQHGLRPEDIGLIAGAAGGPKGLILGPLDRHIFGTWLKDSRHTVHLLGASIGAWRMATAAMREPVRAFEAFEQGYIAQHVDPEPGRRLPSAARVSQGFARTLGDFFAGEVEGILGHPRYRVHVVTTRGLHILRREGRLRTPAGYAGLALSNLVSRKALNAWAQRVVFSSPGEALPVDITDLAHHRAELRADNFAPALQASCSIPFMLQAVHDIPGAPRGAYWDGGITDYHLHWRYASMMVGPGSGPLVLYPHFQRQLVPGWLDKVLKHRHRATPHLDNVIVLAPDEQWVRSLPNAKLPDRDDFLKYAQDVPARVRDWTRAAQESQRLADEWAAWLAAGCPAGRLEAL